MYRVWEAYRKTSPPFPATYETFRTYCSKHGLSGLRNAPIPQGASEASRIEAAPSRSSPPSLKAQASPKVWPRLPGKPREFVPRLEEDESLQRIAALEPSWLHFSHGESVEIAGD